MHQLWADAARDHDSQTGHWKVSWPGVVAAFTLRHPAFDRLSDPSDMLGYLSAIALQMNESDDSVLAPIDEDG